MDLRGVFYVYLFMSLVLSFFSIYVDVGNNSLSPLYVPMKLSLLFVGFILIIKLGESKSVAAEWYKGFIIFGVIAWIAILLSLIIFYVENKYGVAASSLMLLNRFFWQLEGFLMFFLPVGIYFALKAGTKVSFINTLIYLATAIPIILLFIAFVYEGDGFVETLTMTYLFLIEIILLFVLFRSSASRKAKRLIASMFLIGGMPTLMFIILGVFYAGTFLHLLLVLGSVIFLYVKAAKCELAFG